MPSIIVAKDREPLIPRNAIPRNSITVPIAIDYHGDIPERMRRPLGDVVYRDKRGRIVAFYNKRLDWLVVASEEVGRRILEGDPPLSVVDEVLRLAAAYIAANGGPAEADTKSAEICGIPVRFEEIIEHADEVRQCLREAIKRLLGDGVVSVKVAGVDA